MPARVDSLIEEADHLAEDERFDDALAVLARVFAMKLRPPLRVQALMSRASIYDDLGDHARAIADCGAALQLAPRSPDVLYLRSTIHQSAENWAASRADLDAAIALEPQPDLYESRGLARYNLGDYAGAREDFATAIASNDDIEPRFHVYRGMAALLLDNPRAAIDDFTNALALDRDDAKALAQRAKAHEACNDARAALADLDRLRALLPPSPLLEAERARLHAKLRAPTKRTPNRAASKPRAKRRTPTKRTPNRATSKPRAKRRGRSRPKK